MVPSCLRQYRFSLFAAFAFFLTQNPSFADTASSYMSVGSTIWMVGGAALGLLALYSAFLLITFLFKTLKETMAARKEAHAHPVSGHEQEGHFISSVLPWLLGVFTIFISGVFFVVLLLILNHINLASTQSVGALIVQMGAGLFGLLVLYIIFITGSAILKKIAGTKHHGEVGHEPTPGVGGEIPLNPELSRRSFLSLLGWAWVAFTAATMGALSTMLRFAFPNVTFEPPLKFVAGFPDTYSIGVDERYKEAHRVWIVRNQQGFYALSTICTHLGCTPNWLQAEQKFKCPCHGSGYYITGVNFEGPAPRPLPRFNIILADDGQIQIDEAVQYQQELGQWGLPGSFLDYKA